MEYFYLMVLVILLLQVNMLVKIIKNLIRKKFLFLEFVLGHQILALALGAKTKKMKLGHRGANHPVKNLIKR